jgi:small nuclear ribonucleoprotein G
MDKRLTVSLQGGRKVSGVLRGFDIFLNVVIDDAVEESSPAKNRIGTVVRPDDSFSSAKCIWADIGTRL